MVSSKSLISALAMVLIPKVSASPINLENNLLARDGKTPIRVTWQQASDGYLYVELLAGSQKSPVHIIWDTGSYLTWVPAQNMTCDDGTDSCRSWGTFNPDDSTTWVDLHATWDMNYLAGEDNNGVFGTDQVSIGDSNGEVATVKDYVFGVANKGSFHGILGMALSNSSHPNYLPNRLKAQGYINRAAFSYWHDSPLSNTGSFLLGGLDEAKYEGDLIAVPRLKDQGGMKIDLKTIVIDGVPFTQNAFATVDTGAPGLNIPKEAVANITKTLGGSEDSWDGNHFFVPCDYQADKTLDLVFGEEGATVKIPLSGIIGSPSDQAGGLCPVNIWSEDYYLIGVTAQKYAYWVYDQDKDSISIAQATFSTDSKIVSF